MPEIKTEERAAVDSISEMLDLLSSTTKFFLGSLPTKKFFAIRTALEQKTEVGSLVPINARSIESLANKLEKQTSQYRIDPPPFKDWKTSISLSFEYLRQLPSSRDSRLTPRHLAQIAGILDRLLCSERAIEYAVLAPYSLLPADGCCGHINSFCRHASAKDDLQISKDSLELVATAKWHELEPGEDRPYHEHVFCAQVLLYYAFGDHAWRARLEANPFYRTEAGYRYVRGYSKSDANRMLREHGGKWSNEAEHAEPWSPKIDFLGVASEIKNKLKASGFVKIEQLAGHSRDSLESLCGLNKGQSEAVAQVLSGLAGSGLYKDVVLSDGATDPRVAPADDRRTRGFSAIAGMEGLKAILKRDIVGPISNPEAYRRFGVGMPNGFLFYGPPGCGKTYIAKRLAEELGFPFFELSPSSVATPYIHGAVSNIQDIFSKALDAAPSIIFIDEIDGLFPDRAGLGDSADTKREEINEFLIQLNEAGNKGVLVIGATNQPELLDKAVMRSGRMDKLIFIPAPDFDARKKLLSLEISGRPHSDDIDLDYLAAKTELCSCSDLSLIVSEAARAAAELDRALLNEDLLLDSISRMRPSLSQGDLDRYEKFKEFDRK